MVEGKSSQMTQGHEHSPCDIVILMIYIDIYRYRYWSSSLVIGTASKTLGISWIGLRKVSFVIYNNTWGGGVQDSFRTGDDYQRNQSLDYRKERLAGG